MIQAAVIPDVETFEQQGLVLGAKWARWMDENPVLGFGVESQVWYYDGARVYLQLGDALGDSWEALAGLEGQPQAVPQHEPSWYGYEILRQYEAYIYSQTGPPTGGIGPGYRMFPYGVTMAWWRTGDARWKALLEYMVTYSSYIMTNLRYLRKHPIEKGTNWCPWSIREASYVVDILVSWLAVTGETHGLLHDAIYDCVLEDLREYMTPRGLVYVGTSCGRDPAAYTYINNFMVGLALESLIHYYGETADEAMPGFIKQVLDFFWEVSVEKEDPFTLEPSYAQYYNNDPVNGKNKDGVLVPGTLTPVCYTGSSLNLLVAPAYAWYWSRSGEAEYQDMGDKLFSAGVMGAGKSCPASVNCQDYTYHGKQYSQQYKWGFDYVAFRRLPVSSTAEINNQGEGTAGKAGKGKPPKLMAEAEVPPAYDEEQEAMDSVVVEVERV
jgi:hypothetical protein